MSLYVRVFTNFYTHRKTVRLKLAIGNDALWIPPRIWSYAAENQPDGDFSSYSYKELCHLIGYSGDATSMVEALVAAGFLDPDLCIHDWKDHNGYHETFSARAKKAAVARWKGKGKDMKGKDKKRKEASNASAMLQACEKIYAEYPRKVGKPDALKAINRALATHGADLLLERTKAYADARAGQDHQFTPHPATWFNQERFNDDPETWKVLPRQPNPFQPPERESSLLREIRNMKV